MKEMKRRSLSNGKQLNRLGSSFKKDHIVNRMFEMIFLFFLSSFSPPHRRYYSANLSGRVRRNRYVPTVYNLASLSESSALSLFLSSSPSSSSPLSLSRELSGERLQSKLTSSCRSVGDRGIRNSPRRKWRWAQESRSGRTVG